MNKCTAVIVILGFVFVLDRASAQDSTNAAAAPAQNAGTNAADTLKQLVADLRTASSDSAQADLLAKMFKLTATMNPKPEIPEQAREHFIKAETLVKVASNPSDYELAAKEYVHARNLAPWWPDVYYNLALVREAEKQYDRAILDVKLYLASHPDDARAAQDKLYQIQAEKDLAAKHAADEQAKTQAAAQAQEQAFVGKWYGGVIVLGKRYPGVIGTIEISGPFSARISEDFGASRSGNGITVTGNSSLSGFQIHGQSVKFTVATDETWYSGGQVIDRRHRDRDYELGISEDEKKLSGTFLEHSSAGTTVFPATTFDCEFSRSN